LFNEDVHVITAIDMTHDIGQDATSSEDKAVEVFNRHRPTYTICTGDGRTLSRGRRRVMDVLGNRF